MNWFHLHLHFLNYSKSLHFWQYRLICILWKCLSLPTVRRKISPCDKNCAPGMHFDVKIHRMTQHKWAENDD